MKRYGLVTTTEAAKLTNQALMTVHRKIKSGEYNAVAVDMPCGRGGKQYMVDITDLPKSAQMRYIAQMEGGNIGEADIVSYQQRYGDKGVNEVLMRRNAVLECRIIEKDGNGNITARKNEVAARLGVTLRTIYRWRDAYEARGLAGLMDKIEQSNKGKPKNMCLFAQDVIKANLYSAAKHTNRSAYEKLKKLNTELGCKACERCPHCEGSIVRREMALQGAAQEYELCDQAGGGLVIPGSVSTLNRYVQTIPADELAYARYGHRYWEAKYMPKAQRTKPEKINECWFGDHHMFDLFVIDDDGRIVRPWMTAYTDEPMEATEPLVAAQLHDYHVDIAKIESNNGGRGFARSVERILWEQYADRTVAIEWFHQSENKQARILSGASYVMRNLYYPENWDRRWPEYYRDMNTYQRSGKNAHDDAPDATTGIAEMLQGDGQGEFIVY